MSLMRTSKSFSRLYCYISTHGQTVHYLNSIRSARLKYYLNIDELRTDDRIIKTVSQEINKYYI